MAKESLPIPAGRHGMAFLQYLPGYIHPRHRHDELELNLVLRGRATYRIGERVYGIQRGSMLWVFPGQDHHVLEKSSDYTVWIVYWRPRFLAEVCRGDAALAVLTEQDPPGWFLRRLADAQLRRLDQLLREVEGAPTPALQRTGLAYALTLAWSCFAGGAEEQPLRSLHPAVRQAARLLTEHPEIPLQVLARRCALSPSRLSTRFAREVGMALSDFRTQRRLERFLAAHDPVHGNLLASALAAGFGSYSQFHRVFTRQLGMSPRAWAARERTAGRTATPVS